MNMTTLPRKSMQRDMADVSNARMVCINNGFRTLSRQSQADCHAVKSYLPLLPSRLGGLREKWAKTVCEWIKPSRNMRPMGTTTSVRVSSCTSNSPHHANVSTSLMSPPPPSGSVPAQQTVHITPPPPCPHHFRQGQFLYIKQCTSHHLPTTSIRVSSCTANSAHHTTSQSPPSGSVPVHQTVHITPPPNHFRQGQFLHSKQCTSHHLPVTSVRVSSCTSNSPHHTTSQSLPSGSVPAQQTVHITPPPNHLRQGQFLYIKQSTSHHLPITSVRVSSCTSNSPHHTTSQSLPSGSVPAQQTVHITPPPPCPHHFRQGQFLYIKQCTSHHLPTTSIRVSSCTANSAHHTTSQSPPSGSVPVHQTVHITPPPNHFRQGQFLHSKQCTSHHLPVTSVRVSSCTSNSPHHTTSQSLPSGSVPAQQTVHITPPPNHLRQGQFLYIKQSTSHHLPITSVRVSSCTSNSPHHTTSQSLPSGSVPAQQTVHITPPPNHLRQGQFLYIKQSTSHHLPITSVRVSSCTSNSPHHTTSQSPPSGSVPAQQTVHITPPPNHLRQGQFLYIKQSTSHHLPITSVRVSSCTSNSPHHTTSQSPPSGSVPAQQTVHITPPPNHLRQGQFLYIKQSTSHHLPITSVRVSSCTSNSPHHTTSQSPPSGSVPAQQTVHITPPPNHLRQGQFLHSKQCRSHHLPTTSVRVSSCTANSADHTTSQPPPSGSVPAQQTVQITPPPPCPH